MKWFGVKLALGAMAAALVFSAPVEAKVRKAARAPKEFSAEYKATHYCMSCHGRGARGFMGYRPIPQLAGQPPQYIEIQLTAFAERRRLRNLGYVRYDSVHKLTPEQRSALGEYMSKLEPVTHKSAPERLIAAGAELFNNGAPANDVPACAVCHGPDAKGSAIFPRLAGQWRPYLIGQLTNWDKQRGLGPEGKDDNSNIMAPIAKSLTPQQIKEVTAYLSSLK
jgi:cytochrome c553